jgi:hypothetical protein
MNFHICFPYATFPFHSNRYYNAVAQAHAGNMERIPYDPEFKRYTAEVQQENKEICRMPDVLFRRYKRVLEKKKALWIETNCQKMLGSYRVFLTKQPESYDVSLERQIAMLSSAEADPFIIVSCEIQFDTCEFVEEEYCLTGMLTSIVFDRTDTLRVGTPCSLKVGYLNVGTDGRLRTPEVQLDGYVDSMELTTFCYPTDLYKFHELTHYMSSRDLALVEEVLRVSGSTKTIKEIVEHMSWETIRSS